MDVIIVGAVFLVWTYSFIKPEPAVAKPKAKSVGQKIDLLLQALE